MVRGADNIERERVWVSYFVKGKPLTGVYCEKHYIPAEFAPDEGGKDVPIRMIVFGQFRRTVPEGQPAEAGQVIRYERLKPEELMWAAEMVAWLRRECISRGIAFERGNDRQLKGRKK